MTSFDQPWSRRRVVGAGAAGLIGVSVTAACDLLATDPGGAEGSSEQSGGDDAKESPTLAGQVEAGDLPPLAERLPDQPLVVEPLNQPGRYGGTLRGTCLGPTQISDLQFTMVPGLFRFSHDLAEREPHVAESFELSDDLTRCTIRLRKGMRWSDGEPFTADDMLFYFEDWQFDEDLSPVTAPQWIRGGERMQVTKLDDHTVQFDFAIPTPAFALLHYSGAPAEPYVPAHFLRDYHPKYNPDAEANAEKAGYENWQDQFSYYADAHFGEQSVERPVIDPWMPVEMGQDRQRYVRNPYYWVTDSDGRQLPYVDEVIVDYVSDLEVANLRAISGDVSIAGLDLTLANYPTLKNGEEQGNYRAVLLRSEMGSDVAFAFNQEHKDPELREIFRDVRFRQAMSVAINREEINELVFLDQGVPRQATINEDASFYKAEWGEAYAEHDPDLANSLLDEMGLDQRNSDGVRLRPDGEALAFQLEFLPYEGPKTDVADRVVQHWRDVGVAARAEPRDRSYLSTRLEAGEHDASLWHVDRQLERSAYAYGAYSSKTGPGGDSAVLYASGWRNWLRSGGSTGTEPPDEAKELYDALHEWQLYEMDSPEYVETATRVHDLIAETLWVIGVVGQAPRPVMVTNDLENVFTEAVFNADETIWFGPANWSWHPHRAEQWFFKSS